MKRKRLLLLLALLMTAATGAWAQASTTYSVKMKSGTKDAGKWTITSGEKSTTGDKAEGLTGLSENDPVTLTYSGRLKVKSVTATHDGWNGDLSNIPASLIGSDGYTVIVPDGMTLTGTLSVSPTPYKIEIPDGATVTLAGVTIEGTNVDDAAHRHAGITCAGDVTIILADNSANTVRGFYEDYPGIYVTEGKTLTIKGGSEGTGSLTASPFDGGTNKSYGAGIGGGNEIACGNIVIEGGVITATGGCYAAGIGSGYRGGKYGLGNISITGGTVDATGGNNGAGIGCGYGKTEGGITTKSICGNISISKYVTIVTATKGMDATNSIGISDGDYSSCGTVTIGCELDSEGKPKSGTGTVYYDGETKSYQNGGDVYLAQSTLTYPNFDLSTLSFNYVVANGTTLTGWFDGNTQPYKITIADGATVTLADVIFKPVDSENTKWAGINCAGDATIIVKDGTINQVFGMYDGYPAIYVPGEANNSNNNKTLTIKGGTAGTGQLWATGSINAAGIGGGKEIDCGNIIIEGGKITANGTGNGGAAIGAGPSACCGNITITGGDIFASGDTNTPGIGSGYDDSICGKIMISGGTVNAIGGDYAPGIGSGYDGSKCGEILITTGVTQVTASKSIDVTVYSIGPGNNSYCGTVRIGCTLDNNGNPLGGTVYPYGIGDSPYIYTPSH